MPTKANQFIIAGGVLVDAWFMFRAGEPGSAASWPAALLFFGWACVPYVVLWISNRVNHKPKSQEIPNVVGDTIVSLGGAIILIDAFVVQIDAQGGESRPPPEVVA
jgi:hypothetical protein